MTRALRCFVGVPLDEPLRAALTDAQRAVAVADPSWRDEKWVASENLHLTLAFIGDVEAERLDDLARTLGEVVESRDAFTLPVETIEAVPNERRCRMLWGVLLDPERRCEELARAAAHAGAAFGRRPETRRYRPHATLCRARAPRPISPQAVAAAREELGTAPTAMSVVGATLFESRLAPRGPVYRPIGAWRLRGE